MREKLPGRARSAEMRRPRDAAADACVKLPGLADSAR